MKHGGGFNARDKQGKSNSHIQKVAQWQQDAVRQEEGPAYVCTHCGNQRQQENNEGKCTGFAWPLTGMTITTKDKDQKEMC